MCFGNRTLGVVAFGRDHRLNGLEPLDAEWMATFCLRITAAICQQGILIGQAFIEPVEVIGRRGE